MHIFICIFSGYRDNFKIPYIQINLPDHRGSLCSNFTRLGRNLFEIKAKNKILGHVAFFICLCQLFSVYMYLHDAANQKKNNICFNFT